LNSRIPTSLLALAMLATTSSAEPPPVLGYLEPHRIITVSAAEAGVLAEILVSEGASVKTNQVLARLDTKVLEQELEIARSEAKLQATRKQRIEELSSSARSTADELERARTDVAIKEAEVRKIEAMIENRTLRSPVNGVVTEIKRDPSESVSLNQPHVLTVVEIDRLIVNLFLEPTRTKDWKTGSEVNLRLLDENTTAIGVVEFLSPVIDAASGTIRVKFRIDNAEKKHRAGGRCTLVD
jgi:RND family efflux transporter MFP subunit